MSKKRAEFRFQSIVTVIIVLLLLISFVPIALMIMLSFKTNAEVYSNLSFRSQYIGRIAAFSHRDGGCGAYQRIGGGRFFHSLQQQRFEQPLIGYRHPRKESHFPSYIIEKCSYGRNDFCRELVVVQLLYDFCSIHQRTL